MRNPLPFVRRFAAFAARHRSAVPFVAALGFGALAVLGARGYLAERLEIEKARIAPTQATVEVVVARHDLEAGAVVDPGSMAVRAVPADLVPGSAVLPERFEEHVGARILQPMRSGEPLLANTIAGLDASTFSSRIRPGIRAMSVLVDEVNSVSGMLQPGDRIDLLFTVRPPVPPGMAPAPEVTSTLMQDVSVLATGRQVRADAGEGHEMRHDRRHFTAITVEVSPSQAQQLIVAQRTGKLTAMLRNPDDRQPLPPRTLDLHALLGIEPPSPDVVLPRRAGPELIIGGRGSLAAASTVAYGSPRMSAEVAASVVTDPEVGPEAVPEVDSVSGPPAWSLHRFDRAVAPGMSAVSPGEAQ